jgi:hypothetical protein
MTRFSSWPGFVPAIHLFSSYCSQDVDARHKAGHDELCDKLPFHWLPFETGSEERPLGRVSKDEATGPENALEPANERYAFTISRGNTTSISVPECAPVLMWNWARLASTSALVSERLTPELSEA